MSSEFDARRALQNRTLIFVGDSTFVELYATLLELVQMGSYATRNNVLSQWKLLKLRNERSHRTYDSGTSLYTLTSRPRIKFLWNGSRSIMSSSEGITVTWADASWRAQLDNITAPDGQEERVVIMNSGLHDLLCQRFSLAAYESTIAQAVRYIVRETGLALIWIPTSEKFRSYTCGLPRRGSLDVRWMNQRARRAVESVPGTLYFDLEQIRAMGPYEGDGHHCNVKFGEPSDSPNSRYKRYGASCVWRARLVLSALDVLRN